MNEHFKNRVRNVRLLAARFYEKGNQAKCYKAVLKHHVYPVYPMSYVTFLNYMNMDLEIKDEKDKRDDLQLKIFE